jgi:osmotically inducible protein OsmC
MTTDPAPTPTPDVEPLYTARVDNLGGTSGQVRIHEAAGVRLGATSAAPDGVLSLPTGGPTAAASGLNPEQLLAMAWSTCLGETLKVVLAEQGHRVESRVGVEVELHRDPAGGYRFVPRALVEIDELPAEEASRLIAAAHARCPVSKLLTGGGEASVTHRITH